MVFSWLQTHAARSNPELPSLSMKFSNYFALTDFDLPDGNLFHFPTFYPPLDTFEKHLFLFCSHINGLNRDLNLRAARDRHQYLKVCLDLVKVTPKITGGVSNFSNFATSTPRLRTEFQSVQNQSNLVKMILTN